ncbi:MAG: hypothetical protein EA349_02040 [Halomonadaceae bacterium]|nr:MAG: hypothetical protein EA349_02040 [Halomonadaceae bacterium]
MIAMGLGLSIGLHGCFGGSSSSSGNGDNGPEHGNNGGGSPQSSVVTTLDPLSGLSGDAGQDNLLFYFGNDFLSGNLRVLSADEPLVSESYGAGVAFLGRDSIEPIISGDWDANEMDLSNIQTQGVVYIRSREVRFLSAEDNDFPPEFKQVGTGDEYGPAQWSRRLAQNPGNHDEAQMLATGETDNDDVFLLSLSDDPDTDGPAAVEVSNNHLDRQLAAVRDVDTLEPQGWLKAKAEDENETLRLLDLDGDDLGEIQNASDILDNPTEVRVIGDVMPDGSYYLEIKNDQGIFDNAFNLFVLEPESQAGTGEAAWSVHPVTFDGHGDVDIRDDFDPIGIDLASPSQGPVRIAYGDDNDLFFANESLSGEGTAVYRVQGRSAEAVAQSEDDNFKFDQFFRGPESFIWFTGDGEGDVIKQIAIDGSSVEKIADTSTDRSDFGDTFSILDEYDTTVRGHRDGWIFYNLRHLTSSATLRDAAIARNLDGDGYFAVEDAEWVGSSHDGSLGEASLLGDGRLSEVFLMTRDGSDNRNLAAVDASDPEAGMVDLGRLPTGTEAVNEFGRTGGPHRLFQARIDSNNQRAVYVNTREEDSIEILGQAGDISQPVDGF